MEKGAGGRACCPFPFSILDCGKEYNREEGQSVRKVTWNIPNILSLLRVFLAPLVLIFLTFKFTYPVYSVEELELSVTFGDILAGTVFILAALTDTADGYIARKKGMVTNLGKFIDPVADKVLVMAALISLVELQRIPAWIVVVILSRDLIVTGVRMVAAAEGVVIAASRGGKVKTVFQIVAISMLIFNLPFGIQVMWAAMLLTVWSGMDYLIKGKKLFTD
jgi:CDP-diacylglycerol--glycerol-3-phosphate 3-phosphatidyltransferase